MAEKDRERFEKIKETVDDLNASRNGSSSDFEKAKETAIGKVEEILKEMKKENEGEGEGEGENPSDS